MKKIKNWFFDLFLSFPRFYWAFYRFFNKFKIFYVMSDFAYQKIATALFHLFLNFFICFWKLIFLYFWFLFCFLKTQCRCKNFLPVKKKQVAVPEWSKGLDLSPNGVSRVGSNPTSDNFFWAAFLIFFLILVKLIFYIFFWFIS